jgi:hypothetical protein
VYRILRDLAYIGAYRQSQGEPFSASLGLLDARVLFVTLRTWH